MTSRLASLSPRRASIWILALSFAIWAAIYEIAETVWRLF